MQERYCQSRFRVKRFRTREVFVGPVGIGGDNPVRVQSMVNTRTEDVSGTVKQAIALAEAGCEIIRVTAPNIAAARALKDIRKEFSAAGFEKIPLVADIHFLPKAAMEAIEHVEKVRVNPGNYADKKKFAITEYTDAQYAQELERLHEAFSPLVLRAKELGKVLRIGTNHGSLSDRIMNRYGDTPLGMVEAALEFVRICKGHGFEDLVISLKASNPKVMIQAYRLCVAQMKAQGMAYPLHLGVTEAGDGEDGRVKSAIGMGALLADGIGDTVRVSLTEDPIYEIPVAQELVKMAHGLWGEDQPEELFNGQDRIDPYEYVRLNKDIVPKVFIKPSGEDIVKEVIQANNRNPDARVEGVIIENEDFGAVRALEGALVDNGVEYMVELKDVSKLDGGLPKCVLSVGVSELEELLKHPNVNEHEIVLNASASELMGVEELVRGVEGIILSNKSDMGIGQYRELVEAAREMGLKGVRFMLRNCGGGDFSKKMLEASMFSGAMLCDGVGDFITMEYGFDTARETILAYNILQGARVRMTKTEFVACPSCGRTLFNLETTTQRIREATGHLKGVTIAVMGCIVNGPGEMADADFGYVGGAPGKINLYVGKECVEYNIKEDNAVEALIDLIKKHRKWVDA